MREITEEQIREFDRRIYESGWFESHRRLLKRLQEFMDIVYRTSEGTAK